MVDEHIVGISRLSHAGGPQRNVYAVSHVMGGGIYVVLFECRAHSRKRV